MKKRYQVFVSSTYLGLEDARQELLQTLLDSNCIPAGMEMFPASNDDQWTLIRRVIDSCDYLIVVIAGRYGSIDKNSGLSYTELEYDYAVSSGIPVAGFIHDSPGSIGYEHSEKSEEGRVKLEAFRKKVEKRMVKQWSNPHQLAARVSSSLKQLVEDFPRPGWIRADTIEQSADRSLVVPSDVAEREHEIEKLREELRILRNAEISGLDSGDPSSPSFKLSEIAGLILSEAVQDRYGSIVAAGSLSGFCVQTNGVELLSDATAFDEAEWKEALRELRELRFIEETGGRGEVFGVTSGGYRFAKANPSLGLDTIGHQLSELPDGARGYLMEMSRPRNEEGISVSLIRKFPSRENAEFAEWLDQLIDMGLVREVGAFYRLTLQGYKVADRIWGICILRALAELEEGKARFVSTNEIADRVLLTDGPTEEKELRRLLKVLFESSYIQPFHGVSQRVWNDVDEELGVRHTPAGAKFKRRYDEFDLSRTK